MGHDRKLGLVSGSSKKFKAIQDKPWENSRGMEHCVQPTCSAVQGTGTRVTGKEVTHRKCQKSTIKLTPFPIPSANFAFPISVHGPPFSWFPDANSSLLPSFFLTTDIQSTVLSTCHYCPFSTCGFHSQPVASTLTPMCQSGSEPCHPSTTI